jgi:hypothetical protein
MSNPKFMADENGAAPPSWKVTPRALPQGFGLLRAVPLPHKRSVAFHGANSHYGWADRASTEENTVQ